MPRVIKENLHKALLQDYKKLREITTDEEARKTIDDRISRLEIAPTFRPGQKYED